MEEEILSHRRYVAEKKEAWVSRDKGAERFSRKLRKWMEEESLTPEERAKRWEEDLERVRRKKSEEQKRADRRRKNLAKLGMTEAEFDEGVREWMERFAPEEQDRQED